MESRESGSGTLLSITGDGTKVRKVTYPGTGNNSQFTYDGLNHCVDIVETNGGTVTSTKQFVWCGNKMCEARNASSSITAQYLSYGETISGTNYYYTLDYLGSIREMTNGTGSIQAQYIYDPYGRAALLQGGMASDFQYAGYYFHAPSVLDLTRTRTYSSNLGRWINRDPIGEHGGVNLYAYVLNDPVNLIDPWGLVWQFFFSFDPIGPGGYHSSIIGYDDESPGSWFDASAGPQWSSAPLGWGKLTTRCGDAALADFAKQMITGTQVPITLPEGMTPQQFMQQANQYGQEANQILPYNPLAPPGTANSNQFTTGLVGSIGITAPAAPGLFPGIQNPGYGSPLLLPAPITTIHGSL
jgi:RHS repeat-associated protein